MFTSLYNRSSEGQEARVDFSHEENDHADLEMGVLGGGGSDTLSMSHFRNASDEEDSINGSTGITDIEVRMKTALSGQDSVFNRLGGSIDTILVLNVLVYLNADDLTHLGMTNKYFSRLSQSTILWNTLYRRDFISEDVPEQSETASQISLRPTLHSVITAQTGTTNNTAYSKAVYVRRYYEYQQRIDRAKDDAVRAQQDAAHSARMHLLEKFLDF